LAGQVDEEELEPQAVDRQVFRETLADFRQVVRDVGILDYAVILLDVLGNGVAEVDFLLV
jgi:hypothetical protein